MGTPLPERGPRLAGALVGAACALLLAAYTLNCGALATGGPVAAASGAHGRSVSSVEGARGPAGPEGAAPASGGPISTADAFLSYARAAAARAAGGNSGGDAGKQCFEEDCRSSPFIMHAGKTTNTSGGTTSCFQFVAIGCYAAPKGCCPLVARRFTALEFFISERAPRARARAHSGAARGARRGFDAPACTRRICSGMSRLHP